jgi:hypothetical protein
MSDLVFEVHIDDDGNYCAQAEVAGGALFTDGRDLNELHAMILDLLKLYETDSGKLVTSYALRFDSTHPKAA